MEKEREKWFKLVSAVHLLLIKNDEILLLRRFNTGYEDGNFSVPAGHLDGNEQATMAMSREAKEETGIEINPENLNLVHIMHRRSLEERIDFFFTTENWSGIPKIMESHKCDKLEWFSLNDLPENMVPYVRDGINNFLKGVVFSEFGWET